MKDRYSSVSLLDPGGYRPPSFTFRIFPSSRLIYVSVFHFDFDLRIRSNYSSSIASIDSHPLVARSIGGLHLFVSFPNILSINWFVSMNYINDMKTIDDDTLIYFRIWFASILSIWSPLLVILYYKALLIVIGVHNIQIREGLISLI